MTDDRSSGKIPASVYAVDADGVDVVARDGRRWSVAREDFPSGLALVGQPVFLVHDADGFVTGIEGRPSGPMSPELQSQIDAIAAWVGAL
ncbi:hypothetical protein [Rhizobium leguminosarum]|uniref:hypothetical protein n=1 Tax=Rhizobium leguminosarum TaxID=384 RepID=UPI002E10BDA5|nr:hypothetical protein U8Q02_42505 [Rhizobium leguminosarum]